MSCGSLYEAPKHETTNKFILDLHPSLLVRYKNNEESQLSVIYSIYFGAF